jgi:hypothetical protein
MVNIDQLVVTSSGYQGAPGYSTFYAIPGSGGQAAYVAFFQSLALLFDQQISFQIPNSGDTLDSATGDIVGSWSEGSNTTVTGATSSSWIDGVGMRIRWRTGGTNNGRRVVGTTFLVPVAASSFEKNAGLTAAAIGIAQDAADDLLLAMTSPPLIWSRPVAGAGGTTNSIVSAFVPDRVSWLRTRKS